MKKPRRLGGLVGIVTFFVIAPVLATAWDDFWGPICAGVVGLIVGAGAVKILSRQRSAGRF